MVVVAVAGFVFIYFVLFPTSSPKPFSLTSSPAVAPVSSSTRFAGRWKIASGSVAGYRVREKLGFLPAEDDAVGRTSAITGAATFAEASDVVTVMAASFTVDVIDLKSDEAMRDQHIRTIGLQSATYPTATFVLSTPLTLPMGAVKGEVVHTSVTGVFDIHGTSRRESVRLQMRLSNSEIEAVGSLTFPWSKFDMTGRASAASCRSPTGRRWSSSFGSSARSRYRTPLSDLAGVIRVTPKARRWPYSHGLIRRCMPGRGGDAHHPRRPFRAPLSLAALIGGRPAHARFRNLK